MFIYLLNFEHQIEMHVKLKGGLISPKYGIYNQLNLFTSIVFN